MPDPLRADVVESGPRLRRANGAWNPAHGTWHGKAELPAGPDGRHEILWAGGFRTETELAVWFTDALALIDIPDAGPAGHGDRQQIAAMIRESRKVKADLPDVDDVRRHYRHGAAFETGTTGGTCLRGSRNGAALGTSPATRSGLRVAYPGLPARLR